MKVAIVFDPDPDLGTDPLDPHAMPRSQGMLLDSDKTDVLIVWREWGEQFEDGYRTHVIPSGIWENVTEEEIDGMLAAIGATIDPDA